MNLWIQIMVIAMLGVITIGCGGNNSKGNNPIRTTVNSAGQNVAEDGRIVLSSQTEDSPLVIPEGTLKGRAIHRQKLAKSIADKLEEVSIVSDLSFSPDLSSSPMLLHLYDPDPDIFTVSFTVTTHLGAVYRGIQCEAKASNILLFFNKKLHLENCKSRDVKFFKTLTISI